MLGSSTKPKWEIARIQSQHTCGGCLSSVYAKNNTMCELTNLKPYMAYSISAKAKTLAGFGEESIPVIVTTLESGMLFLVFYNFRE